MSTAIEYIFWLSAVGVVYAYVGYPLALKLLCLFVARPGERAGDAASEPTVTMLIPVHNERTVIEKKIRNVQELQYRPGGLNVLFLADGCTDGTVECLRPHEDDRISVIELTSRGGKAMALNTGLERTHSDIVVFSDASILLRPDAVRRIVAPFADPKIGCVSGEDVIEQGGGEGLYGRYELAIRRLESQVHSIVGASGSFYAQRRELCEPFLPGLAPDFYSVLRTVARGFRAVSEPSAVGVMNALADPRAEFSRKVRTILRGITTLAQYSPLLNPIRYGWFAFELLSHKLVRWLVPLFLCLLVMTSALLAWQSSFFAAVFVLQVLFYALAALSLGGSRTVAGWLPARVSLYFTSVNVATASAWLKFFVGDRQELWSPSRR